jgi:alpha-L-fucosidase
LAKDAGMKYIVITAKHHDGFAMYHSEVSSYNIVDWTPFKRDPLKELSVACAEEGIRFGVYYSHREDWEHPGGYGNNWDYDNDWGSDFYDNEKFSKYLEEKAKPQLKEQGQAFVSLVHKLQPATLINGRVGHYDQEFLGDYQSMADNGMPPGGLQEYWETPMTLNNTWGFSKFDTLWKSPATIILRLVEIVSRGGNYLLNIGPEGNGEIPGRTVDIFREVGPWVKRNAESIYGSTSNPFGELDWGYCTVKDNKLFLFVRDWPKDATISFSGLQNTVNSSYLLIDKSTKLTVIKSENITRIILPKNPPDNPVTVLVVETDGTPSVNPPEAQQPENGVIMLNYLTAMTSGKAVTRFNRKGGFHISKWKSPEDSVVWNLNVERPGKFHVRIDYAANNEWEGQPFEIMIGKSKIEKHVIYTGNWFEYHEFPVGYIDLPEAGKYTLTMHPMEKGDNYLMYLRSIILYPVNNSKAAGWGTD